MLRIGPAVLARLVGHCEVCEDALRFETRQPARLHDAVDAMLEIIAVADVAEPRHTGIHFDMNLQRATVLHHLRTVFVRLRLTGHRLRDVEADQPVDLLLRCVPKNQNRHRDAVKPELHRFVNAGDREVIRAELLQLLPDMYRAMAVGVGLHHAEKLPVPTDVVPNHMIVVAQGIEIDLRPGSPKC